MSAYDDLIPRAAATASNPYADLIRLSDKVPNNVVSPEPPPSEKSLFSKAVDRVKGNFETPLALATGALATAGGVAAAVGNMVVGRGDTPQDTGETIRNVREAVAYRPRSDSAKSDLETIGKLFDESKLAGLTPTNPSGALSTASQAGKGVRQGATAVRAAVGDIGAVEAPAMAGVGSAMTDAARLRADRAAQLPVPLPLTKGMLTRDFEQQRFERETAKAGEAGRPLREREADLREKIVQNFDAWIDETGAESGSLRATGQAVNDAIVRKAERAKMEINNAYSKARASGETAAPVNVAPLVEYVQAHKPEAINAPIISSVEAKLATIAKKDAMGQPLATVNDIEEVRKMVGALSGKDATNAHFGRELKSVIDGITETAGGKEYQRARMLRTRYAREFEDVGVIDKLLSTKPGTRDRAVGYEDVFQHSIRGGTLDDVRSIRRTLQTEGPAGEQAWRELQGETLKYMKDQMTKNVARDIRGNEIPSAAALHRVVRELDADGKLDFIFGKKGAQNIRDINETLKDVTVTPPGAVNTSGTASVLMDALGNAAMGRIPTAAGKAIAAIQNMRKTSATNKKVMEALNP